MNSAEALQITYLDSWAHLKLSVLLSVPLNVRTSHNDSRAVIMM
jgi:hypothetical protein